MPVLWVVENPQSTPFDLARTLQGEFPIRVFASVASFVKLLRIAATPAPDACLIVALRGQRELRAIERRFHQFHPLAPCVFLAEQDEGYDAAVIAWPRDPLAQIRCVRALLEQPDDAGREVPVSYRDLVLDAEKNLVTVGGTVMALTVKEFRLLRLFVQNAARCLHRDEIKGAIWGDLAVTPRTIDVHVSRLRKHLADTGVTIEPVYGDGYVLR